MKLILLLYAAACWNLSDGKRACPSGLGFRYRFSTDCEPCRSGQYAAADTDQCQWCPTGYTSGAEGATGVSSCTKCREGRFRDGDSGDCVKCPKGTYSDTPEAASCTSCPEGTTTQRDGYWNEHFCHDVSCSPGEGFNWHTFSCEQCVRARYSTDGQTPGCVQCPRDSVTRETGATSEDQCEHYLNFTYDELRGVYY